MKPLCLPNLRTRLRLRLARWLVPELHAKCVENEQRLRLQNERLKSFEAMNIDDRLTELEKFEAEVVIAARTQYVVIGNPERVKE